MKPQFIEIQEKIKAAGDEAEKKREKAKQEQKNQAVSTATRKKRRLESKKLTDVQQDFVDGLDEKSLNTLEIEFRDYNPNTFKMIGDDWEKYIQLLNNARKFVRDNPKSKGIYFHKLFAGEAKIQREIDEIQYAENLEQTLIQLKSMKDYIIKVKKLFVSLQALHEILRGEGADPWTLESMLYIGEPDPVKWNGNIMRAMIIYYLEEKWFSEGFEQLKNYERNDLRTAMQELRSETLKKLKDATKAILYLATEPIPPIPYLPNADGATEDEAKGTDGATKDPADDLFDDDSDDRATKCKKDKKECEGLIKKINELDDFNLLRNLEAQRVENDDAKTQANLKSKFYLYQLLDRIKTSQVKDGKYVESLFRAMNGRSLEDELSSAAGETNAAGSASVQLTRAALTDWMSQIASDVSITPGAGLDATSDLRF